MNREFWNLESESIREIQNRDSRERGEIPGSFLWVIETEGLFPNLHSEIFDLRS